MSKDRIREGGILVLAQEVKKDLERITQENPEYRRTIGESSLMKIIFSVLEGCAKTDVDSTLQFTSHMYDVPPRTKEKIMRIREMSTETKGPEVIERYFKSAEKEHLTEYCLSRLGHFVVHSQDVEWARQVSKELGILFNETRARIIRDKRAEEVYGYVSDQIKEANSLHETIKNCQINTRCIGKRYKGKVGEIEGMISDLKEENIDTGRLEAQIDRLAKKHEGMIDNDLAQKKYGKIVRTAIVLVLTGLLSYATGFYVCNKQSEEKLTDYRRTINGLNEQYYDTWVNDSLIDQIEK